MATKKKKPELLDRLVDRDPNDGIDHSNTKRCEENGKHYCGLMQAALDSKGQMQKTHSFTTGASYISYQRKKPRNPILIFSYCPFCGGKL